ncbi:MAG: FKBP-type peptidyl-prolyl cis-trans isomerase [Flammeovirgaceae bacterium]
MANYFFIFFVSLVFFLSACSSQEKSDFKKSPTGIEYLIRSNGNGVKPKRGEVVMMKVTLHHPQGNPLTNTPYTQGVYGHPIHGKSTLARSIDPILLKCSSGDSLLMHLKASLLFGKTFLPQGVNANDLLYLQAKIEDIITFTDYQDIQQERLAQEAEKRIQQNDSLLLAYAEQHQFMPAKLRSGVYYYITQAGKGKSPVEGDIVHLDYTVYRLDGERVDASADRGKPFQFVVGRGAVIKGLDQAIRKLKTGGRATILIPSDLAYGGESKGKQLPPHSNLRFEVSLLSIEK